MFNENQERFINICLDVDMGWGFIISKFVIAIVLMLKLMINWIVTDFL